MSSISSVPTEILGEIFLHVCEIGYPLQDPSSGLVETRDPRVESPVTAINLVCSSWHSITLSTPLLWSRFRLIVPLLSKSSNSLFAFLGRSGNSPLDFCLYLFDVQTVSAESVSLLRSAFSHLVDEAHRWRNVQIGLPSSSQFMGVPSLRLSDWPQNFPVLETLFLETPGDSHTETLPITPGITIPRLSVLSLKGQWTMKPVDLSGNICSSTSISVSPHLLIVEVEYFHWGAIELVSPSTAVRVRRFFGAWAHDVTICRAGRLEMCPGPVYGRYPGNIHLPLDTIIRQVNLPNVTELVFGRDFSSRPKGPFPIAGFEFIIIPIVFPSDDFIDLLSQRCNAAKITHFSLMHYIITDIDVLEILAHLPSLTSLTIDEGFPYPNEEARLDDNNIKFSLTIPFFHALVQSSISSSLPTLISSLEELKLAFHPNHLFTVSSNSLLEECTTALLDLVESRAIGRRGCLKKVRVHMRTDYYPVEERIQTLREQGVDIEFSES
ncbi:hypothetical protein VKT23_018526 [Stygiomarasmius scandens]|uniref:F-box domain-containing protein n=1 Tax=Marasmiellus scandens TaxID=2682957 RepID=A0ABR1IS19_9AGAR